MQQERDQQQQETAASKSTQRFVDKTAKDVLADKRRMVEVPYTATVADTLNTMVANKVLAVPVAAPPGQWIGAGSSLIMESDKQTGVARKQYIGIVTMLDIATQIADDNEDLIGGDVAGGGSTDQETKMSVPVSSLIGHSLEGLNLWTLNPNTCILECMEQFSKGIHRALVPVDSKMENVKGVELVESASCYRMLTQMDLLKFLKDHSSELKDIFMKGMKELGAINENVYAINDRTKVIDAIKCLRTAMIHAVPIVQCSNDFEEDHRHLMNGKGRKLIGTFSATDLRGCPFSTLQRWLSLPAHQFTQQVSSSPLVAAREEGQGQGLSSKELVTCHPDSSLLEVMDKLVSKHVHRVWVVDHQQGLLLGLVSLTDVIGALRVSILSMVDAM